MTVAESVCVSGFRDDEFSREYWAYVRSIMKNGTLTSDQKKAKVLENAIELGERILEAET